MHAKNITLSLNGKSISLSMSEANALASELARALSGRGSFVTNEATSGFAAVHGDKGRRNHAAQPQGSPARTDC